MSVVIGGTTASLTKGGSVFMTALYLPLIVCCSYLNISWESMTLLGTLIFIDYLTGIIKVYVIDKSRLRSYKAIAGILAKLTILLIPIIVSILGKQANIDMGQFTNTIITMLMLAETFSIIGNIRSIHQRKEVEEIDAISFVLSKISAMLMALLKANK